MSRAPEIEEHWQRLRELGCIVTGRPYPTIHHCHGGSMRERGVHRGMAQKTSDWLVIPLAIELHSMGPHAIDGGMGVETWESVFGRQADFLDQIAEWFGIDVWARAMEER